MFFFLFVLQFYFTLMHSFFCCCHNFYFTTSPLLLAFVKPHMPHRSVNGDGYTGFPFHVNPKWIHSSPKLAKGSSKSNPKSTPTGENDLPPTTHTHTRSYQHKRKRRWWETKEGGGKQMGL